MDDVLNCPVCGNKLRNHNLLNKRLPFLDEVGNFVERNCTLGHNHSLQMFVDLATNKVVYLKLSLNHLYSRFVEINFVTEKCRILCMKDCECQYIDIDKLIEPDFPDLTKLKERVSLYVVFS